jgi:ABC-type polysaccharide/polyol phosphate export permease
MSAQPSTDLAVPVAPASQLQLAWKDVVDGIRAYPVWATLSAMDIRQRYRRSILGPFWITITMMVLILGMGPLYGTLFGIDLDEFLPYLSMGVITWGLISTLILEGAASFVNAENLLRSVKLPYTAHIMRVLKRNLVVFAHNLLAFVPFMLYLGIEPHWRWLLMIPGVVLLMMVALPASYMLSVLCTRFRDLQQIIASAVQLAFFLTPIFWKSSLLKHRVYFAEWNPFHWLIEIVRRPIVEGYVPWVTYAKVFGLIVLLYAIAIPFFVRYRRRLAFWV